MVGVVGVVGVVVFSRPPKPEELELTALAAAEKNLTTNIKYYTKFEISIFSN